MFSKTMSPTAVEEAQSMALKCIQTSYRDCGLTIQPTLEKVATKEKIIPEKFTPTSSELRSYFISQTQLQRKQVQYALKELGHYASSIDGIWGKGTSRALQEFLGEEGNIENLDDIYSTLVAKVNVPSKFAEPKRQVVTKQATKTVNTAKLTGDARVCADYGFTPGTQQFLQCLGNLRQQRQNEANMLMNLGQGLMNNAYGPAPSIGSIFCQRRGNYLSCN